MENYYSKIRALIESPLKSTSRFVMLAFLVGFSSLDVYGQSRTVSGKVTASEDGSALPGVTLVIKGTTTGTVADIDGNFKMEVPNNEAVLVASFIGYESKEIVVGSRSVIDFDLSIDVETLDEVVITGYGDPMKKSELTSAHVTVGAKDIERTVNTTIEQALQGRASGVLVTQNSGQPGGGISVKVRGINSIGGSTEPLYVIDGVQIGVSDISFGATSSSNPLAGLNPSDIASMEVLQGPSATAIYGSRGTNGVILITTKRGKSGKVKLSYGYQNSVQTPPKSLDVLNLREYATMVKEYHEIAGGETPAALLDASILGEGTDWQKALYKNAVMQKHSLSASGGSDNTTYFLSGEYMNQDGVAIGSGFKRYSMRLNLDNKIRENVTVGVNFSYNQTEEKLSSTSENTIRDGLKLSPEIPVRNFDGSFAGPVDRIGKNQFTPPNPVGVASLTTNQQKRRQLLGGINFGVEVIKGLKVSTAFNTNIQFAEGVYFQPTYDFGGSARTIATLSQTANSNFSWNWNQMIQYNKSFGKHNLGLMATHESQASEYKNLTAGRSKFVDESIIDLGIGDAATATNAGGQGAWAMESYLGRLTYNFDEKYIVMGTVRTDGSVNFGPENKWGTFPSISAAWRVAEESFFNVGFINDLKLRAEFGLTGNQGGSAGIYAPLSGSPTTSGTGFLPSRFSNPKTKWEETLTYNYGINMGLFENRFVFEFDYYIRQTDNLLMNASLPYYVGTAPIPGGQSAPLVNLGSLETKGWSLTLNTVNIDNGGFKWETNFNISSFKSIITELNSKTAALDRTSWWMENWTQRSVVGQSPWLFLGYIQDGVFQTVEEIENSALPVDNNGDELAIGVDDVWIGDAKFRDVSGPEGVPDGKIDQNDLTFIGNPWPKLFSGFTNTFSYKGFELSILLTGSYGNDIYNYLAKDNTNPNNINLNRNMLAGAYDFARVSVDDQGNAILLNPGTTVSRLSNGPNANYARHTSTWVEDGSFIRVKNVGLTYRLPDALLSKQSVVRAVRLTVSAQNIYTLTNYSGYDPEVGAYVGRDASSGNQAIGVDNGRYPLTPVYSFGIGIDF